MKKLLIVGAFILSAISFANTEIKTEIKTETAKPKDNKVKTAVVKTNKTNSVKTNSVEKEWWMTDTQMDRGSDRK